MLSSKLVKTTLTLLLASAVAVSLQASHHTLVVDDDGADCPEATFQSIQAAVDAASAGDTIEVCPGTYLERVSVTKTLKLLGPKHGKDGQKRNLQSKGEAVVASSTPFSLSADDIVLDGFTIEVVLDESGEGAGIFTSELFSGYQILNNVGDADGVTLLFPGCNGQKRSVARRNHFFNRLGIATSDDEPRAVANNLLIEENLFTDSTLLLASGEDTNVVIRKNKLEGSPRSEFGIGVFNAQGVTIEQNKILGLTGDSIQIADSSNVLVSDNLLRDGVGTAIWLHSILSDVRVEWNRIAGFTAYGLTIENSSGVVVSNNEIEDNRDGIRLLTASANNIEHNNIEDNAGVGIDVSADSSANQFASNELGGNRPLDCQDSSSGTGTAGTANIWVHNDCNRSNPKALCSTH